MSVIVTDDMVARFEDLGLVHPLYSTWTMIRHMELASRKVILPYLEQDEDAVGYKVDVTHFAATPVGMRVTVRARLLRVEGNRIVCALEAFNEHEQIGAGENVQVLLSKDQVKALSRGRSSR